MSATNYKGGISLAGRHVAVIGLSFRESSYSLGFKNTQFSIANALIPICHTPKIVSSGSLHVAGVQLNWYYNTSAKNSFHLIYLE